MNPVYEFINFNLINISYSRKGNELPVITELKAVITNREDNKYTLTSKIIITFSNEDIASLTFTSLYLINDFKWSNTIGEDGLTSVLFAAVFPFIREKLFNLTSDSRTPIMLPVIDLKNTNIKLGVKFERRLKSKE